jgi:hypothetical protein
MGWSVLVQRAACYPHRRWGARLIFIKEEILEYLSSLPGVSIEEAREAQRKRTI